MREYIEDKRKMYSLFDYVNARIARTQNFVAEDIVSILDFLSLMQNSRKDSRENRISAGIGIKVLCESFYFYVTFWSAAFSRGSDEVLRTCIKGFALNAVTRVRSRAWQDRRDVTLEKVFKKTHEDL